MKRIAALCLLVFAASCAAPGLPQVALSAPADTPAASIQATPAPAQPARLGESVVLAYWKQGKTEMRPVDPATGQDLPSYAPILAAPTAYSPDGVTLAAIESEGHYCESFQGGSACRPRATALHLVDLSIWGDTRTPLSPDGWAASIAFSPDGSRVALAHVSRDDSSVILADARTGEIIAQHNLAFRPDIVGFQPDGASLAVYGQAYGEKPGISQPGVPTLQLLDATSLEVEWEHTFPDLLSGIWCLQSCDQPHSEDLSALWAMWSPAVILSRNGGALYIVHADEDRLTTVDLMARTVSSVAIAAPQSWIERLLALTAGVAQAKGGMEGAEKQAVLSPDGSRLYITGQVTHSTRDDQGIWQYDQHHLGLQAVEVAIGHVLGTGDTEAWNIRFAPDGQHLLLTSWNGPPSTQVVDAASLDTTTTVANWEVVAGRRLNGQPILLGSDPGDNSSRLAVIDPATFEVAYSWISDGYDTWLAVP